MNDYPTPKTTMQTIAEERGYRYSGTEMLRDQSESLMTSAKIRAIKIAREIGQELMFVLAPDRYLLYSRPIRRVR